MTTDTAALVKEIFAEIKSIRALRHPVVRVTHLAARFGVLSMKKRMQPEGIKAVRFHDTGSRAPIAAVTGRAAEFFRIMDLEQLFPRVTHKSVGQIVRLFAGTIRRKVGCFNCQRLASPQVTNLTAIDNAVFVNADLMTQDGVVERVLVLAN